MHPSTECLSIPKGDISEVAELENEDGADIVLKAAQLHVFLDRSIVGRNLLLDQISDSVVKAILTVGADTDMQLKQVSQRSYNYDRLAKGIREWTARLQLPLERFDCS